MDTGTETSTQRAANWLALTLFVGVVGWLAHERGWFDSPASRRRKRRRRAQLRRDVGSFESFQQRRYGLTLPHAQIDE